MFGRSSSGSSKSDKLHGLRGRETRDRERDRVSFELLEEDVEQLRARGVVLTDGRRQQQAAQEPAPVLSEEQAAFESWRVKQGPCLLTQFASFAKLLQGKRLTVFLDYDGTLAPIVSNPDEAYMAPEMREVVRQVSALFPTAIISGRGREKVQNFVQLKELYYAGSHGMDIVGPSDAGPTELTCNFQAAANFRPIIDQVYHQLIDRLKDIPGSTVEHNTFCVSAHYRNCAPEDWHRVIQSVEDIVGREATNALRITRGRKVVEIRPKVDWNKGTALNHLLQVLSLKDQPDVVAIYIGDDHTDEDAFRALKEAGKGFGILVSTKPKPTEAKFTVRDPAEVQTFLEQLISWGQSEDNGWGGKGPYQTWRATLAPKQKGIASNM